MKRMKRNYYSAKKQSQCISPTQLLREKEMESLKIKNTNLSKQIAELRTVKTRLQSDIDYLFKEKLEIEYKNNRYHQVICDLDQKSRNWLKKFVECSSDLHEIMSFINLAKNLKNKKGLFKNLESPSTSLEEQNSSKQVVDDQVIQSPTIKVTRNNQQKSNNETSDVRVQDNNEPEISHEETQDETEESGSEENETNFNSRGNSNLMNSDSSPQQEEEEDETSDEELKDDSDEAEEPSLSLALYTIREETPERSKNASSTFTSQYSELESYLKPNTSAENEVNFTQENFTKFEFSRTSLTVEASTSFNRTVDVENQTNTSFNRTVDLEYQTNTSFDRTGEVENQANTSFDRTGAVENQTNTSFDRTGDVENRAKTSFDRTGEVVNRASTSFDRTVVDESRAQTSFNRTDGKENQTRVDECTSSEDEDGPFLSYVNRRKSIVKRKTIGSPIPSKVQKRTSIIKRGLCDNTFSSENTLKNSGEISENDDHQSTSMNSQQTVVEKTDNYTTSYMDSQLDLANNSAISDSFFEKSSIHSTPLITHTALVNKSMTPLRSKICVRRGRLKKSEPELVVNLTRLDLSSSNIKKYLKDETLNIPEKENISVKREERKGSSRKKNSASKIKREESPTLRDSTNIKPSPKRPKRAAKPSSLKEPSLNKKMRRSR